MNLKSNLLIYVTVGMIIYLLNNMSVTEVLVLVQHIIISIVIGKSVEYASYKIAEKYKFNFVTSLVFSFLVLLTILLIMKYLGLIGSFIIVLPVSLIITVFMVILSFKRSKVYNEKLEKVKQELNKGVTDENS